MVGDEKSGSLTAALYESLRSGFSVGVNGFRWAYGIKPHAVLHGLIAACACVLQSYHSADSDA